MAITDLWSDFVAAISWTELHAEAPAEDDKKEVETREGGEDDVKEESEEKEGDNDEKADEGGEEAEQKEEAEEEEQEEKEEEEEEEEPEDPKPKLEADCSRSAQCAPMKHHYEECVARVTAKEEDKNYKGPKEDCVEEFFHLQHCVAQCAAPKLFKLLK